MLRAFRLDKVRFAFCNEQTHTEKLRGLVDFGPYRGLTADPYFGFVFPAEFRDSANQLYLALKNGVGSFKGVETTFRFRLTREQVFQISDFSIRDKTPREAAAIYRDAILRWRSAQGRQIPDIFFVLHPQSAPADADTPYYKSKAKLLTDGILSQNVTFELLEDEAKFQWSAANIALGAFVKLGGIPWIVSGAEADQELIIGVGRSFLYDSASRTTSGYVGFTACFSARGKFEFLAIAKVAQDRREYLELLGDVVADALNRAESLGRPISTLTIHVPKEMSRDEANVISEAAISHGKDNIFRIVVVKISEEDSFFAVDTRFKDGVAQRGTVIQISDRDYTLYTEGREEKEPWSGFRSPVALRVTPQGRSVNANVRTVLRQVNDLSQVNWRGFNARSKPISTYYGMLIAQILSHIPADNLRRLSQSARELMEERIWFI